MRALPTRTLLIRCFTLVALASVCSVAMASKVYQWKDARGVSHYSDNPPPGQKFQDRRVDNRGEPIPEVSSSAVEHPMCTTAKRNLQVLAGANPVVQDTTADGKADKTLNDEERTTQRTLAEAAVKAYCTSAAPTAGR
ncbi:MAG: DUF4124 domain-containing protein [Pseudoxanthomonas sp.]|nr:DUF4124 domain-containing protein [Pseudoxanthomonas sp.]